MKTVLLFCLFGLFACESPQESISYFRYTKDLRTGQCFALYHMGGNGASMTYVPCTPEVEAEIKREELERH